jgi:hypothetical protein
MVTIDQITRRLRSTVALPIRFLLYLSAHFAKRHAVGCEQQRFAIVQEAGKPMRGFRVDQTGRRFQWLRTDNPAEPWLTPYGSISLIIDGAGCRDSRSERQGRGEAVGVTAA